MFIDNSIIKMEKFITDLNIKIIEHNQLTKEKIHYLEVYKNEYYCNYHRAKDAYESYLLYQKKCKNLFFTIMMDCINFVNTKKINFYNIEKEFRNRNMNIYIIAKKFVKNNESEFCSLHNKNKDYQANFIVSNDKEFYTSELFKYGYKTINDNHKNLNNCGLMSVNC